MLRPIRALKANPFAVVLGAGRMSSIFDNEKPLLPRDRIDLVHRARQPREVNRDDRPCPGRDSILDLRGVNVEPVGGGIGENRAGSDVFHHIGRGRECHGGNDHLLTRTDPVCQQGQMHCGGARVGGDGVLSVLRFLDDAIEFVVALEKLFHKVSASANWSRYSWP